MIELIHRAPGIHELVVHQLCQESGSYRDAGLEVEVVDGTGPRWRTASASPSAATVAVGGVVADWLRGDRDWNVYFVATAKPMMWLVGTRASGVASSLEGARVATPDRNHMPSLFLRLILQRRGLDTSSDVEFVEVASRSDRLRLLEDGQVDASLLGPEGLALDGERYCPLLYVGDHIEFPTVGLAARSGLDPHVATAIAKVMSAGLQRLRTDTNAAVAAMCAVEPAIPAELAAAIVRDVVAPGWRGPEWARSGSCGDVSAIPTLLGIGTVPEDMLRVFLHRWASETAE